MMLTNVSLEWIKQKLAFTMYKLSDDSLLSCDRSPLTQLFHMFSRVNTALLKTAADKFFVNIAAFYSEFSLVKISELGLYFYQAKYSIKKLAHFDWRKFINGYLSDDDKKRFAL